jgi:acyl dehydratase
MGLPVEDFHVGRQWTTRGRTVGEGDIMQFAGLAGDWTPIHVDEAYARATPYGTRIAHGPLAMSMAIGLFAQAGVLGESVIGLLHLDWTFRAPVKIGDTVHAEVRVAESRLASKPGTGVVRFAFELRLQDGSTAQTGVMTVLMKACGAIGADASRAAGDPVAG